MADPGLQLDYNHSAMLGTAYRANEPFSDKNGLQSWYGQTAAPPGLLSDSYGNVHAEQGGLAEPAPARLSGDMSATLGYQERFPTGLQGPPSIQPSPISGYMGSFPALPYSGRPGEFSDFPKPGSEDRMGFSLPQGHTPYYNKAAPFLPRSLNSGDKGPFLPSPYNFGNQRPPSGLQGQSSASSRKSYKNFDDSEDYENPRELEYMKYANPEELNKPEAVEENEDLEGLGELMLNRYVLPSQQAKPSKAGGVSARSGVPVRNDGRPCGGRGENARGFSPRSGARMRKERQLGGPHDPDIYPPERSTFQRSNRQAHRGPASPLRRRSPSYPVQQSVFSDSTNYEPFPDDGAPFHHSRRSERLNEADSYSAPRGVSPSATSPVARRPDHHGPQSIIPAKYPEHPLPIPLHQDSNTDHFGQWTAPRPSPSVLRGTRSTDVGPPFSRSGRPTQDPPIRWVKTDLTRIRIHCSMNTPEEKDEKPARYFRQHFRRHSPSYSRGRTRRSRSPPLQPQHPFRERLDRHSRSPHFSSRYQSSHPRNRRSRSEHYGMSEYRPSRTRSKSPISTVPRRQSPYSQSSSLRRSPQQLSSRSRRPSPSRQHYRDNGRSPPRYRSRGRSAHRSRARSRSPRPLKEHSPDGLDLHKHSRNPSYSRTASKGRSRSRHHSPSGGRYTHSRSPRSKRNSPLRKAVDSKTSSKNRSLSPDNGANKSRGRSPPRSRSSRNEPKINKGRSSMSPLKTLSATPLPCDQSTEQSKQTAEACEDSSLIDVARSQTVSIDPLSSSVQDTELWQTAESLGNPVENVTPLSGPMQHFGVMIRPFPLECSDKDISYDTFRKFKTFGHVTSIEIHNSDENRFCLVFYNDSDGQKCALNESQKLEIFHQIVSVTAWDGPETESKVVFRPLFRSKAQPFERKVTKTLLIRNLDAKLARGDIHHCFQAFGKILEINIKKKLDDRGCYAFLQYSDISSVTRAIKEMDGSLFGDYRVKLSYGNTEPTRCVWIDGIKGVSDSILTQAFMPYGQVVKVSIDNVNNKALVFFADIESAKKAINFSREKKLSGYSLMMDYANSECQTDYYNAINATNQVTAQLHEFLLSDNRPN